MKRYSVWLAVLLVLACSSPGDDIIRKVQGSSPGKFFGENQSAFGTVQEAFATAAGPEGSVVWKAFAAPKGEDWIVQADVRNETVHLLLQWQCRPDTGWCNLSYADADGRKLGRGYEVARALLPMQCKALGIRQ